MILRYWFPSDEELPTPPIPFMVDDNHQWWAGVRQCFVSVGLAAAAAVLSTSFLAASVVDAGDEQIPAATLSGQPDEDYWQNQVPPITASIYQQLPYLPDTEDVPAASLHGQPDEDFYWNALYGVPRPVTATTNPLAIPQWQYDVQEPSGSLFGQYDEDFWDNPVAPTIATIWQHLPLGDPEELPAGSLFGQPDEDYWVSGVPPQQLSFYQPLPYSFDSSDIVPQVAATLSPDEDYWQNTVPPVAGINTWPQQWTFDTQEPAGLLFGQYDEDFWNNPVPPVGQTYFRSLNFGLDSDEIPAGNLFGQPDEDYWISGVAPISSQLYQHLPYLPDAGETVPTVAAIGNPDEDYWNNSVAPTLSSLYQRLPLGDPEEVPAGSLYGCLDEDFDWSSLFGPLPTKAALYQPLPYFFDAGEIVPHIGPVPIADEDYWQNPIQPISNTFAPLLPLSFDAVEFVVPIPTNDVQILSRFTRQADSTSLAYGSETATFIVPAEIQPN